MVLLPAVLALVLSAPPIAGEVELPLEAFDALMQRSRSPVVQQDAPPVPATVRQAVYQVVAQGKSARIHLQLTVDVLAAEGFTQPVAGLEAALLALKVDGKPSGAWAQDGMYAVHLLPGTHVLDVDVLVGVEADGPASLALKVPEALAARLVAELPGRGLTVDVAGVETPRLERQGSGTRVTAALPVTGELALSWVSAGAVEEEEEPAKPSGHAVPGRARATVLHHLAVDEAVLRGTVRATFNVQKGTRSQVVMLLPADVEVLDVQSQDVREWTALVDGAHRRVLVVFKYGRTGEVPVTVRYEKSLGEAAEKRTVTVPEPGLEDVEAERGFVGVEAAPGVEVALQEVQGAEGLESRDLPSELWAMAGTPLVLGVKYLEHPVRVTVAVSQRAKVQVADTTLDSARFETVVTQQGRAVSAVNYAVRNHQRQYLEVELPKDTQVLSCFVGGRAVRPARGSGNALFIPLNRSTAAEGSGAAFPVELVIAQDVGRMHALSHVELEMPATQVQAMELAWSVFVPATHAGLVFDGNFSLAADARSPSRWFTGLVMQSQDALAGMDGFRSKQESLEGYDFSQGVKARFAAKMDDSTTTAVRVSRPLVGRRYDFRANLLRAASPTVTVWLMDHDTLAGSGWLAAVLALLASLLLLSRRMGLGMEMGPKAPLQLALVGVVLGLLSGLYLDEVMGRVVLALLVAPLGLAALHLRETARMAVRRVGWVFLLASLGALCVAALAGVFGGSVVGTAVATAFSFAMSHLVRRFLLRPPAGAAPPSGMPVAAGTSGGAA